MNSNLNVKGISIKIINRIMIVMSVIISILLIISFIVLSRRYSELDESTKDYISWKDNATQVLEASDYLTKQARSYVVSERETYLEYYFVEVNETKRREKSLDAIRKINSTSAFSDLEKAVEKSKSLSLTEYYAMRLIILKKNATITDYPKEIQDVVLSSEDFSLSNDELKSKAIDLLFNEKYLDDKDAISKNVSSSISALNNILETNLSKASKNLLVVIIFQCILIGLLVLFCIIMAITVSITFVKPIDRAVVQIINGRKINDSGIKEYKYLANAYNLMCERSISDKSKLLFNSEHDGLTHIYNRTGYLNIFESLDISKIIYILIDVDFFKHINDKHGHNIGDLALIRVSNVLCSIFDKSYICRIGGDEFAIIITNKQISKEKIIEKVKRANYELSKPEDNLPALSLSVGVAYGEEGDNTDTIFKKADSALYNVKNAGRAGVQIYHKD